MSPASGEPAYAGVAVPVPLRRIFTYLVGPEIRKAIGVGSRVVVPFGRRTVRGTVVAWPAPPPDDAIRPKAIEAVEADAPVLGSALLALARFVADYYLCSWGEAIEAAMPPEPAPLRRKARIDAGAAPVVPVAEAPVPTAGQTEVLGQLLPAVRERRYQPFVLYGATGSGKTEVYLRAAAEALAAGRGVLYLVPEIGLTPLLVSRIESRFPGLVAVMHSALAPRVRRRTWDRIRAGELRFVVGARSAVFAPLPDPGLFVVDEEHDPSYKQEDAPRYNGRDLAIVRAREANAPVVLGSATPSLESYHHAAAGRYTLLRLGGRVEGRPLPEVRLVDMRREYLDRGEARPLSRELVAALQDCLARGDQALVLRNRRGWAASLLCPACGVRVSCRRCSIALTWHRAAGRMRCHTCGYEEARPASCPSCRVTELREIGEGTERIEDELRLAVPEARIARLDRDTVRRRGEHEAVLRRFDRGDVDLLVGTQMIAKGHDFPRVTLVGILSADQALGLPDFRAGERAFQLVTQVAGRAGRGDRPGIVVAQAFDPSHPVLVQAARQDFEAFFASEMRYRRALKYPPVAALVRIVVSSPDPYKVREWAAIAAAALESVARGKFVVTGPGPAPIERIQGRWRQQILLRTAGRRRLVEAVAETLDRIGKAVPARAIHVDVDPVSLM